MKIQFTPEQEEVIRLNGARFEEPLLFIHTKKAVNNGHPEDRLLLVIGYERIDPSPDGSLRDRKSGNWIKKLHFIAWKCEITAEGIIHPEFHTRDAHGYCKHRPLSVDDVIKKGNTMGKKSEPTAWFKPDSYYKQITIEELKVLIEKSKEKSASSREAQIAKTALVGPLYKGKFLMETKQQSTSDDQHKLARIQDMRQQVYRIIEEMRVLAHSMDSDLERLTAMNLINTQ